MMTIFSIPKPFEGHIGIIQRNAINSWLQLYPSCEIILYGNEVGIHEICDELGLVHEKNIKLNECGTPHLDYVFKDVQSKSKHEILCYINSDIILLSDFIKTVQRIVEQLSNSFLIVGQRCDIDISDPIDMDDEKWENIVKTNVKTNGKYLGPIAIDFFIFSKQGNISLLPFLVGRRGWDNWLIYYARKRNISVIDISNAVTVIHQNHDYNHIHVRRGKQLDGPESDYNLNLVGGKIVQKSGIYWWTTNDSDYYVTPERQIQKRDGPSNIFKKLVLRSPEYFHPIIGAICLTISTPIEILKKIRRNTGV